VTLLLLLRLAVLWVGIYLGLVANDPGAVMAVQILVWPFAFLSNAFVATSTMPGWLGAIAAWNPMAATVTSTRQLFGVPAAAGDGWAADHAHLLSVGWPTLLTVVFATLSIRRYQELSR
jgi:ABC-type multidrug transport system permease subunit